MEIRMQQLVLTGRIVGNPIERADGTYFRLDAGKNEKPFPCVCEGKTAANLTQYCQDGDEISIQGKLEWKKFRNSPVAVLLVRAIYVSYGRKARTLR